MNLFQKILFYISVPKCVCCGERLNIEDRAICARCFEEYTTHKLRECSVCGNALSLCTCTNDYLKRRYTRRLVKLFRYIKRDNEENDSQKPSNMLIYSLKRDNREDVLSFLADELAAAIKQNIAPDSENYIITSIPRRRGAVRKYGIDHAKLLASAVAKRLELSYCTLLVSTAKSPQKKMRDRQRIKNATFDYKKNTPNINGKRVIIIDDIVTTGASMGAAAMLIHALGAKEIIGAALSIAYKDKYIDLSGQP